jgi:16S rRNA (cytosine967-C5)-methyltransferase
VLDACAGVGGKSTHLLELLGPAVELHAADSSPRKLELLQEHARRLGLPTPVVHTVDLAASPGVPAGPFDLVILDAPCTGLGVARRRPDVRWRRGPEDPPRMGELQRRLLEAVAPRVAAGGTLVYSVCTYTAAEGEQVIDGFLAAHPELVVDDPPTAVPGGVPWGELCPGPPRLHLLPSRHDTDGFFAARLRRR